MSVNETSNIISEIGKKNSFSVAKITSLTGGDINKVFLITTTSSEEFVVKLNRADKFPGMFQAEKTGLEALAAAQNIDVPEVITFGSIENIAYLLLEYKSPGKPVKDFWEIFGSQMASLHKNTSKKFGFKKQNYIGSLPQYNSSCTTASEFYITQRLEPQIKIAQENNHQLEISDNFFKNIAEAIPEEPPALIHGDLWNGNYLINSQGLPCLIDPAVAYAPREMDLAMMQLFEGFDQKLYDTYNEEFPLKANAKKRIDLWQLYYLLIHLNLFGAGYKDSVINIIKSYH